MIRRFTKADLIAALLIAAFLPLYYKARYILEGQMSWSDVLAPTVWIEFVFSALLGFGLVALHRSFKQSTRMGFIILTAASAIAAVAFTVFFYTIVFPFGAPGSFLFDVTLLALASPLLISGVRDRVLLGERAAIAEHGLLQARYEVLKSRLSPHFLFNSLSTLSDLVEDDPTLATRFIERMAQVYRYIIEHQGDKSIGLDREIEAAQALLFVLETRHPGALVVSALLPEQAAQFKTAPLAVQSLVENALKHNRYSPSAPLTISIRIEENDLVVENSLNPRNDRPSLNTGLESLKERLEMLTGRTMRYGVSSGRFRVRAPLIASAQ